MEEFVAEIGARMMGEQVLPVQELGYVFTRTDLYMKRRNRSMSLTEGRRWLHLTLALERWIVKKAQREAAKTEAGLAYCRPHIEYQREPSVRGWQVAVWLDWAAVPGQLGDTLRVAESISKDWQVL